MSDRCCVVRTAVTFDERRTCSEVCVGKAPGLRQLHAIHRGGRGGDRGLPRPPPGLAGGARCRGRLR